MSRMHASDVARSSEAAHARPWTAARGVSWPEGGAVALVGAGPGDPELLTVRAARLIATGDVILHDHLIGDEILDLAPAARRVDVGKTGGGRSMPQAEINRMMVEAARSGARVARLKGGDPFVFGRGGEEARAVRDAGLPLLVVPGISAAVAAPGVAGIPVTHRGVASHFTVVTCVGAEGKTEEIERAWSALGRAGGTLVFLMGLRRADAIARVLIGAGRAPETPVAVIGSATRADQRIVVSTLRDLGVVARDVAQPATIVVGEVVRLSEHAGSCDGVSPTWEWIQALAG